MQKPTELPNFLNFKVAGLFTLVTVHANAQRDKKPWQLTHTGSAGVMALRTLDQLRVEVGARFTVWNAAAPCKAGKKIIGPISMCVPKV